MESRKKGIHKWLFIVLAGVVLAPFPVIAGDTVPATTTTPAMITAPLDDSGNQYRRKEQNGDGYTMSADELGLRQRAGDQQENGNRTRQHRRNQSGNGSGQQHHYGSNGSYSGNHGSGNDNRHGRSGRCR